MATSRRRPRKKGRAPTQRVLALDLSSVCWGWALFDGESLTDHGRVVLKGDNHGVKMAQAFAWLDQMFEATTPNVVLFEKPFAGGHKNAFGVLMMYAGLVRLCHARHFGVDVEGEQMVMPHLVKRALGIPRPAKVRRGKTQSKSARHETNKKLVLLEVNRLYGLSLKFKSDDQKKKKTSQDDEADAIALGHYWLTRGEVADD